MSTDKKVFQEYILEQDQELRFGVESKAEKVYLTLKSGKAEVFGTELVKGKTYEFTTGAKIAVFTWHGCILEVKGKHDFIHIAKETPMTIYANCHGTLELLRIEAENEKGPIAMIVGPTDVGKSTLCRLLLNYAVRMGRRPIFVDLDVGQGQISIPGTIGALMIERPASIDEGFSQDNPLVYNFGYKSPNGNSTLFNLLINQLATTVKERLEVNKKTRTSGVIINTCGWTKSEGYKQLVTSAKAFEVEIIMVLDQERLYNELVRDLPNFVKIVFLPKSGGIVERSKSMRAEAREARMREYFYGTTKNSLYPHLFDVKFSEVKIFKIGTPESPELCLPLRMKSDEHMTKLVVLTPNAGLLHHILAISFAEKEEEVVTSHVAGFVCVTNVDAERQIMTLLSPQPKPLPNHILVLSEIQFMDTH